MTFSEAKKLLKIIGEDGKQKYPLEDLTSLKDVTVLRGNYYSSARIRIPIKPLTAEQAFEIHEKEKIDGSRYPTPEEVNQIYCNIHSRNL